MGNCFKTINYAARVDNKSSFKDANVQSVISCFYSNVDTLTQTKKLELEAFITVNSPNIIGLTEVLPKNSIFQVNETYFNLENYDLFTTSLDKGRGVVLYIQKKILCVISIYNNKF